ncbi:MAG TPA: hypothetical protein DEB39_02140 [Planctomycetaceae bacterium]|nr:hypothetical protein [Planctomycetaceae bacterium]
MGFGKEKQGNNLVSMILPDSAPCAENGRNFKPSPPTLGVSLLQGPFCVSWTVCWTADLSGFYVLFFRHFDIIMD